MSLFLLMYVAIFADSAGESETTPHSSQATESSDDVRGLSASDGPSSLLETRSVIGSNQASDAPSLCIAVVGATGELARNKVFPALFALYYSGFLPEVLILSPCHDVCSYHMSPLSRSCFAECRYIWIF